MKTQAEAIAFLVANHKPENLARAAINESFNFEIDLDFHNKLLSEGKFSHPRGLLYGWPDGSGDGDAEPMDFSEAEILNAYDTMVSYFTIENGAICLDGEPTYDMNGYHLQYQQ